MSVFIASIHGPPVWLILIAFSIVAIIVAAVVAVAVVIFVGTKPKK